MQPTLEPQVPQVGRVQIRVANAADPEGDPGAAGIGAAGTGAAGTGAAGLGMGLRQVQQRLRGHFGAGAQFHAGPLAGGFEVVLGFPLALEEAADA